MTGDRARYFPGILYVDFDRYIDAATIKRWKRRRMRRESKRYTHEETAERAGGMLPARDDRKRANSRM